MDAVEETIEAILDRQLRPETAPTEDAWHHIWTARSLGADAPIASATLGGALSDRLPWVFISGYQAANRRAFFELPGINGWTSFAASEDREGKLAGATLTEAGGSLELSGAKTWIAASGHVQRLVVTVGAGDEQRLVVVDRDSEGVALESYDRASFLGDMTQGRATFEGARIDLELSGPTSLRGFGAAEPLHVLTALNAFMLSHTVALAGPALLVGQTIASIQAASQLGEHDLTSEVMTYGLAGLDAHTQAAAAEFEALIEATDAGLHERWSADRRLVSMFSTGINKRAEAVADRTAAS